jgi:metal-responsive CopG/Arc/MetJ family transcriptional regulator
MKKFTSLGVSLPNELAQRIETERGDVNRSRYVLRILQKYYNMIDKAAGGSTKRK